MFSGNPEAFRMFVYSWICKDVDHEEIFGKSSAVSQEVRCFVLASERDERLKTMIERIKRKLWRY